MAHGVGAGLRADVDERRRYRGAGIEVALHAGAQFGPHSTQSVPCGGQLGQGLRHATLLLRVEVEVAQRALEQTLGPDLVARLHAHGGGDDRCLHRSVQRPRHTPLLMPQHRCRARGRNLETGVRGRKVGISRRDLLAEPLVNGKRPRDEWPKGHERNGNAPGENAAGGRDEPGQRHA